ncbi:MAG: SDR family oxidoreductase [bacterium JZ-2024 1]
MKEFSGKKALVTGGSRGVGRAIAEELARRGCDVAINYLRNMEAAEETARTVRSYGSDCILLRKNLYKVENIKAMFEEYDRQWESLDFFVSNAALGVLRGVSDFPEKGWELAMDVNAKAYLFGAAEAAKRMKNGKGKIVGISSIGSHFVLPGYVAIGASKAAIEAITRYLAYELAPRNIYVNAVSGGPVLTDALRSFPNYEQIVKFTEERSPFKRLGTPQEIAKVVAWLLSDESDWVLGQTIVVDGGLSLGAL